ncbi:MAG: class I SAM-dependent methyltransferase [Gemmatimonadota bacterium]
MTVSDAPFPRSATYNPAWLTAGVSGGANPLQLTEWLCSAIELTPGMRVLDLACGRAMSSIFLHREYGVQVWATDLWFDVSENLQRIRDAGADGGVFPLHADARALPFAHEFFDAIVCIDAIPYFGTDETFLSNLARFVKPGGTIAYAGAGLVREIEGDLPEHLAAWWEPPMWSLHSPAWWARHWGRTGIVDVERADVMDDGWQHWLAWHRQIAPDNVVEMTAVETDAGSYLGYGRAIARRRPDVPLDAPLASVPTTYQHVPLLPPAA